MTSSKKTCHATLVTYPYVNSLIFLCTKIEVGECKYSLKIEVGDLFLLY